MIKKSMMIIIIGAVLSAMVISVSADEIAPIDRIVTREVGSEDGLTDEPIVEEVSYEDVKDDLVIAPNPEAIDHNAKAGERDLDITSDDAAENDLIIAPNDTWKNEKEDDLIEAGISILGIVGIAISLAIALVILNKRKLEG